MTTAHRRILISAGWTGAAALFVCLAQPLPLYAQMNAQLLVGGEVSQIGAEREDLQGAIAKFAEGDSDAARRLLAAAVSKNAQLPPPDVLLARLYLAANDVAGARAALEKAVVANPEDPEAFVALGETAFGRNQVAEAAPLFEKGLKLCDSYKANSVRQRLLQVRALSGAAAVDERRGQWERAEQWMTRWLAIDPKDRSAQTRLARAQFEQGKYREAFATFTRLHEQADGAPRPEINMALLYGQAAQQPGREQLHENAKKFMDLAVERAPQDPETRLAVAQWALEAGLMDLAKANARAALEVDPSSLPARIAVGVVARNEKDDARALELFTSAHLQSPANFAAMNHLALTLIQQSDPGERRRALEFAQVNARLYGDLRLAAGREAAVTLAWVLFKLGRDAEAFQHLSAAGQAGSITPESTYYAASILVSRGNPDAARKLLEGCLRQEHIFPHREDAQALLETLRAPP